MLSKKKTQMLYQEAILIVISILIISLTLYLAITYISGTKTTIEKMGPEISYKFPASFVHGFLYTEVSKEDVKKLSLDETRKYYVKDLIYIDGGKEYTEIINKLKVEYILNMNKLSQDNNGYSNMHTYYKEFSKQNYDEKSLLEISYSQENVPLLENSIKDNNYFYFLKTENGKYTIIYFISSSNSNIQEDSSAIKEVIVSR